MTLPVGDVRTPSTIRIVEVTLISGLVLDVETGLYGNESKRATFALTVLDQNGDRMPPISGDLLPHLSDEQITGLVQFMDDMRALAEAALPTT